MGDAGEGLIDADARIQERRDEIVTNGRTAGVGQRGAQRPPHVDEHLPVLLGAPGRCDGTRCRLQLALSVDEGSVFLDPGRTGQHDVGRLSERGQQHALHDEQR